MASNSGRSIYRGGIMALFALIGVALTIPEADARRLGGGKGFGRQAPQARQPAAQPPARDVQPAPAAPAQANPGQARGSQPAGAAPNRWLGPLGGLAAGLGIAALLSHLGLVGPLAELLGSVLVIGLLAFAAMFLWRMLRASVNSSIGGPGPEPAYSAPRTGGARPGSIAATIGSRDLPGGATLAQPSWGVPTGFEIEPFLHNAKAHFARLQRAWDARNLAEIREFTTPEMFAEIRSQLAQDPDAVDRTGVETLDAELLGIEDGPHDWLASVRFEGMIREVEGQPAQPFSEIWNLSKPKAGRSGWLLAGIQQVH